MPSREDEFWAKALWRMGRSACRMNEFAEQAELGVQIPWPMCRCSCLLDREVLCTMGCRENDSQMILSFAGQSIVPNNQEWLKEKARLQHLHGQSDAKIHY